MTTQMWFTWLVSALFMWVAMQAWLRGQVFIGKSPKEFMAQLGLLALVIIVFGIFSFCGWYYSLVASLM